jgi:hypothetical protein
MSQNVKDLPTDKLAGELIDGIKKLQSQRDQFRGLLEQLIDKCRDRRLRKHRTVHRRNQARACTVGSKEAGWPSYFFTRRRRRKGSFGPLGASALADHPSRAEDRRDSTTRSHPSRTKSTGLSDNPVEIPTLA